MVDALALMLYEATASVLYDATASIALLITVSSMLLYHFRGLRFALRAKIKSCLRASSCLQSRHHFWQGTIQYRRTVITI